VLHNSHHAGTVSAGMPTPERTEMTAKQDRAAEEKEPAPISKEQRDAELADLAALEAKIAERRRQLAATGLESVPQSEFHTWPDGSSAVGVPPFPEESPKQRAARLAREHAVVHTDMIPPGMKRSGEAVVEGAAGETQSSFVGRVEEQVQADVTSGKDPSTRNPTTSSDKPALANMVTVDTLAQKVILPADPTEEDLQKLVAQVNPDVAATEEEKIAATLQVMRETKGPIVADEPGAKKDEPAKKSTK
jgi:hypothetical protein